MEYFTIFSAGGEDVIVAGARECSGERLLLVEGVTVIRLQEKSIVDGRG